MKKAVLGLLLAASTNYVLAGAVSSPITKIYRVFTYGNFAVLSIGNGPNGSGCSNKNFIAFDTTTSGGKALYSSALTAFTTGAQVRFGTNGCVSWGGTVPKAYRIELLK